MKTETYNSNAKRFTSQAAADKYNAAVNRGYSVTYVGPCVAQADKLPGKGWYMFRLVGGGVLYYV